MKKGLSDVWVAISVIVCSVVLFVALAMGLSGNFIMPGAHLVFVRFPDVTGINVSSQVRYGGARAGVVSAVRMLTVNERKDDPKNLVEITLKLFPEVPPLTNNTQVTIASETLLSDKFVLLADDPATGEPLGPKFVLQGTPPTTFDQLARNIDSSLEGLRKLLGGGTADSANDLLSRINGLVGQTEEVLTGLQPVVSDAGTVMGDAKATLSDARAAATDLRSLLASNKDGIGRAVTRIDSAAGSLASLAKKGETMIRDNESNLNRSIVNMRITSENLKVTSTYSKFLLKNIAERPNRLIWGSRPQPLPTEQEILNSREGIPLRQ